MNTDHIRTFLEVATTGNFNRAADNLNVQKARAELAALHQLAGLSGLLLPGDRPADLEADEEQRKRRHERADRQQRHGDHERGAPRRSRGGRFGGCSWFGHRATARSYHIALPCKV